MKQFVEVEFEFSDGKKVVRFDNLGKIADLIDTLSAAYFDLDLKIELEKQKRKKKKKGCKD